MTLAAAHARAVISAVSSEGCDEVDTHPPEVQSTALFRYGTRRDAIGFSRPERIARGCEPRQAGLFRRWQNPAAIELAGPLRYTGTRLSGGTGASPASPPVPRLLLIATVQSF